MSELDRDESRFPARAGAGCMPWLEKLGLGRPELRAWAMYDWANSAMVHDHHRRFPDLLRVGGLCGHDARTGHPVVQPLRPRSAWSSSP